MSDFSSRLPDNLYTHVGSTDPTTTDADVFEGHTWLDTGANELKTWDGTQWVTTTITRHDELTNVTADDHHNPVTVSGPLTEDGTQGIGLTVGDGLTVTSGALNVPPDAIGTSELDFVAPLGDDGAGRLALALNAGLHVDANGRLEIPSSGVTTGMLAADAVTNAKIAADAVANAQVAADAVDTTQLVADAVTSTEIAADAVTAAQIAAGSVGNTQLAADAATSTEIAADAVTATQILADAVGTSELDFVAPLADDGAGRLALALNAGLHVDANGRLEIPSSGVTTGMLAADAVTNGEIAADAVTATQVADGETLPTSITGDADTVDGLHANQLARRTRSRRRRAAMTASYY